MFAMIFSVNRFTNILFYCFVLLSCGYEGSTRAKESLSLCNLAESANRFVFVSTLDGKLTALNPNNEGAILWTIHPGSQSMISSSIHKLELSNYGHLVRMIPSLGGGLYVFNGENIELVPVTSDHLLQSSLKYSEDVVISGGKEIHTFGVALNSGNLIYECSMKNCGNISHSTDGEEILVVQRQSQVVRALEAKTGAEKWNFSVAQLDLKLVSECHPSASAKLNYHLKVIIPEGIVYAADNKNPNNIFWRQKFSSPVVNAWELYKGKLIQLDLFSNKASNFNSVSSPSLYIGMHNKQLYIQESNIMATKRQEIVSKTNQNLISNEENYPVIPWKPVPASGALLGLPWQLIESENTLDDASQRQTTALSVLYASPYVDGSGFFLYAEQDSQNVKTIPVADSQELASRSSNLFDSISENNEFSSTDIPFEIVIALLWYYWKEILVIITTTGILCNIMLNRAMKRKIRSLSIPNNSSTNPLQSCLKEKDSGIDTNDVQPEKILKLDLPQDYVSRYLTDFEPVACLGKGGFGVVFEAKKKIDDCHYAIKRILLPTKLESRDRVMREVKALAQLDHSHIVRYFHAWTECPPYGWQEQHDMFWLNKDSDIFTSNKFTSHNSTSILKRIGTNSSIANPIGSFTDLIDEVSLAKNDISDSFVVFEKNSGDSKSNSKFSTKTGISIDSDTEKTTGLNYKTSKSLHQSVKKKFDRSVSLESNDSSKVYLYIQMQLCQRHSLRDWLTTNTKRNYTQVLSIFEQILQAVEHVHLHGLIHRDLKPSNIFFSLDNQIKVGDFGLVTTMTEEDIQMTPMGKVKLGLNSERHTAQVGTQLYMSQEQLMGKPYNYKVDIYSLGIILFELLTPFNTQMERIKVLQDIKNDKFPQSFQKKYKKEHELLRLMLSNTPEERPTTYGVRARLPLKQEPVEENWHFELPGRRNHLTRISFSLSSSEESEKSENFL